MSDTDNSDGKEVYYLDEGETIAISFSLPISSHESGDDETTQVRFDCEVTIKNGKPVAGALLPDPVEEFFLKQQDRKTILKQAKAYAKQNVRALLKRNQISFTGSTGNTSSHTKPNLADDSLTLFDSKQNTIDKGEGNDEDSGIRNIETAKAMRDILRQIKNEP
jgi:hypothetical protein